MSGMPHRCARLRSRNDWRAGLCFFRLKIQRQSAERAKRHNLLSEPMVNYLAAGAWGLVALLLVANMALRIPDVISQERELSKHFGPTEIVTTAPAPVPDMASETIPLRPNKPTDQSAPEVLGTIEPATRSEAIPLSPSKPTDQSTPEVRGTIEPAKHSDALPLSSDTHSTAQSAPEVPVTVEPATRSEAVPLPPMRPMPQPATRSTRANAQAPKKRVPYEQPPISQLQSDTGGFSIKD